MRDRWALLLAAMLLLLLWKLCYPQKMLDLRDRAEEVLFPGARQTVEAWGSALAEQERVPAQGPGEAP